MADEAIAIRPAKEADEAILRELWEEFEREVPEPAGFEPETWEDEWRDTVRQIAAGGVFLAVDPEGPVGVAKIDEPKLGAMHIHLVYVRPRARRQGVVKQLLRECVATARASGAATLSLHVLLTNTEAHAVWRRLGFESVSTFMAAPLDASRSASSNASPASTARQPTCKVTTRCRSSERSRNSCHGSRSRS